MLLTIRNKTLNNVVINSELGSVGSRKILVLDLTIDEIERAKSDLVRLAAAGVIVWMTDKSADSRDDAAEAATIAYADASATPTDHNNLAGLQGGTVGEYVHLTSAEYASLATKAVQLRGLRNFTTTDYYERAAGSVLQGNADPGFEVMIAAVLDLVEGTGLSSREIISNSFQFTENGYMLGVDDLRPVFAITNGAGSRFGIFFGNWARARQGKALVFLSMGYDNTAGERFLVVNGQDMVRTSQAGYTAATTLPVRLGFNAEGGTASARGMTVVGYAMRTLGALTSAQREDSIRTFLTTGNFPTAYFQHRFPLKNLPLGAAPATLVDDIGGINLTRVGSAVVVVDETPAGQAITTSPPPDDIVTLTGGFFAPPNQQVSVAGPTVISSSQVRCVTASVAPTLTLPPFPSAGVEILIYDMSGNAAANNITINANAGQSINGVGSTTISTNYGSVRLAFGGTDWTIVG